MSGARGDATPAPGTIARLAPAKLNLTLAVLRRTDDGFHALHSVMVPLALADHLTVTVARPRRGAAGPADTVRVSGFDAGPAAENLVTLAIRTTRHAVRATWPGAPGEPPPLAARLRKRIPVAAGLGGGSSDAASAIDAALEAWDARLDLEQATLVAARVGSDVPFFLAGGPALVTGRGEQVTPLPAIRGTPPGVLLVAPSLPLSTPAVFATLDAGVRPYVGGAARVASEHLATELRGGLTAARLLDRAAALASSNDLLPASVAIAPSLLAFRRGLARLLRRPIGQSGSGPTAWVLYASEEEAAAAAREVRAAIRDGRVVFPGDRPPLVVATHILPGHGTAGYDVTSGSAAEGAAGGSAVGSRATTTADPAPGIPAPSPESAPLARSDPSDPSDTTSKPPGR